LFRRPRPARGNIPFKETILLVAVTLTVVCCVR
jgi:hypothetical protein